MIVNVPFSYSATVIRGRRRTTESARYNAETFVDLREVESSESPIAIVYSEPPKKGIHRNDFELRWFEGRLYRPFGYYDVQGVFTQKNVEWMKHTLAKGDDSNPLLTYSKPGNMNTTPELDVKAKIISNSDFENSVIEITDTAKNIIIINDGIWRKCNEPLINHYFNDKYYGLTITHDTFSLNPMNMFRLDEDHLFEEMAKIDPNSWPCGGSSTNLDFEVLVPECLRAKTTERALLWASSLYLQHLKQLRTEISTPIRVLEESLMPFEIRMNGSFLTRTIFDDDNTKTQLLDDLPGILKSALESSRDISEDKGFSLAKEIVETALRRVELVAEARRDRDVELDSLSF